MAKIRHLAIRTEDPGKLAKFYIDVFGLEVLHRDKREEEGTSFDKMATSISPFYLIPISERPSACITSALKWKALRQLSRT